VLVLCSAVVFVFYRVLAMAVIVLIRVVVVCTAVCDFGSGFVNRGYLCVLVVFLFFEFVYVSELALSLCRFLVCDFAAVSSFSLTM